MRRMGLWMAAALVVLSTAASLGLAALNRSGEPEAVLELTERELSLPSQEADNTAMMLGFVYERLRDSEPYRPNDAGWFDQAKLQSIGFDCSAPATTENASHYRAMAPRSVYAVLEFEGETWQREMAEPVPVAVETPAGAPKRGGTVPPDTIENRRLQSHLTVEDVGLDPTALRARHPDRRRVAIVEAVANLIFVIPQGRAPFLMGRVTRIWPEELNVPREWRAPLEGLSPAPRNAADPPSPHEPRYRVTVKWGKNLEPWIADLKPIAASAPVGSPSAGR